MSLKEIATFLIGNFGQKNPPNGFFILMSNLIKSHFGQVDLDMIALIRFFCLVFFTKPPRQ
jgi:hypothetical protein